MRTLAKERSARFGTMREVVEALWTVLGGRPAPVPGGVGAVASAPTEQAPVQITPPRVTPEALAPTESLSGPPVATGPAPAPARKPPWVLPVVMGVVVVAGAGAWAVKRATTHAAPQATASASASASTTAPPVSANPEAVRLYALGNETWRTDSDMAGFDAWQRAVQLDPELRQAQVRIAAYGWMYPDVNAAAAYEVARKCEGALDARDRALLDAVAPLHARPVDQAMVASATQRAVDAFPDDPGILYLRGITRGGPDPAASLPDYDHIIQIDPQFVHAYAYKARTLEGLGRRMEADATLVACNAANPAPTFCTSDAITALGESGRCAEAESMARRFVALRPSKPAGYNWLALALAARAAPPEAIEAAMDQTLARETPGTSELLSRTHREPCPGQDIVRKLHGST